MPTLETAPPVTRDRILHGTAISAEQRQARQDAVIAAARAHRLREPVRCDAVQVVRDRATFWSVLAASQDRPFSLDLADAPALVATGAADLGAALDVVVRAAAHLGRLAVLRGQAGGVLVVTRRCERGRRGGQVGAFVAARGGIGRRVSGRILRDGLFCCRL